MAVKKLGSRVVHIRPSGLSPSSPGMITRRWWLQRNNSPEELEVRIGQGKLAIRASIEGEEAAR
jgi:hypothetical protein